MQGCCMYWWTCIQKLYRSRRLWYFFSFTAQSATAKKISIFGALAYCSFISYKCWHRVAAEAYLLSGGMRWGQARSHPWLDSGCFSCCVKLESVAYPFLHRWSHHAAWFSWGYRVAVRYHEYKCIITGMWLKSHEIVWLKYTPNTCFYYYNKILILLCVAAIVYCISSLSTIFVWQIQDMAIRCIQKNIKKNRGVKGWPWWKLMTTVRPLIQVQLTEEQIRGKDVSTHVRNTHTDEVNFSLGLTNIKLHLT